MRVATEESSQRISENRRWAASLSSFLGLNDLIRQGDRVIVDIRVAAASGEPESRRSPSVNWVGKAPPFALALFDKGSPAKSLKMRESSASESLDKGRSSKINGLLGA